MKVPSEEIPLTQVEQVLQLAALLEGFISKAARDCRMSLLDARCLLCMARLALEGEWETKPTDLCEMTGLPRNRMSEILARLERDHLVVRRGTDGFDRRTRTVRLVANGFKVGAALMKSLGPVEIQMRSALRSFDRDGRAGNLEKAEERLKKLPI